jgi:DNA-binding PadR family transcriptional regulator
MSAKHALLGLLLQGSSYPYQLADRLEERLGPSWLVDSGQIYKTIKEMEELGLIESVDQSGEERDERRRFFAITERGTKEFERWFHTTTGRVRLPRRPLLLKVTLAGPERLKEALKQIDAYELDGTTCLKEILRAREEIPHPGAQVRADHLLLRVNLGADIAHLEGELQWARDARDVVSRLLSQKAIWPSTSERRSATAERAKLLEGVRGELFDQLAVNLLQATPEELETC